MRGARCRQFQSKIFSRQEISCLSPPDPGCLVPKYIFPFKYFRASARALVAIQAVFLKYTCWIYCGGEIQIAVVHTLLAFCIVPDWRCGRLPRTSSESVHIIKCICLSKDEPIFRRARVTILSEYTQGHLLSPMHTSFCDVRTCCTYIPTPMDYDSFHDTGCIIPTTETRFLPHVL